MTDAAPAPRFEAKLSVVVPCYNEESNIDALHRALTAVCAEAASDYEIVLVNDGSSDHSWERLRALVDRDPHVVAIDLSRNHGHQLALSAGLSLCRGERILLIDADLQDPPELLPAMMQRMDAGADVVYGQRVQRQGETRFKKVSAYLFYRLLSLMSDVAIPRDTGDFRLMNRKVLDVLLAMPERNRFIRGMVAWAGFRQVAIPYERKKRNAGSTRYTLLKMASFALDAITGFSAVPLRLSIGLSLFFFLMSGVIFVYILYSYLFRNVINGWTSLAVMVTLFAAVQLLCVGIIGEYVSRIYVETKQRPLFLVREIYTAQREQPAKPS
jgi:glycosyltransferase involved in cell wall biosynthesis